MKLIIISFFILFCSSCATSLNWPQAPQTLSSTSIAVAQLSNKQQVMQYVQGNYAHYDVVAYEDNSGKKPMRTFIISYGLSEFYIEDNELMQKDRFCHAEQKINYKTVKSTFNDEATQAIKPPSQKVDIYQENGQWKIYRPPTPTLLGVKGDNELPLPRNRYDINLTDPDKDGKPGVTVDILIGGFLKGKLYITRREIFENYLTVNNDNTLTGWVKDSSEQFVVGANMKMLDKPSNPSQLEDENFNPLILVKVDETVQNCEQLMQNRDLYFPAEPEFF